MCYAVTVQTEPDEDDRKWELQFHVCELSEVIPRIHNENPMFHEPWQIIVSNLGGKTHG